MDLKHFLRGLGAGIILATIILTVTFSIKSNNANIINKARSLGMVFENEITSSKKNIDETTTDNNASAEESTSLKDNKATENNSTENVTTKKENNDIQETTTDIEKKTTEDTTTAINKIYKLTIERGNNSYVVAAMLEKMGAVKNAADFDSYLCNNGYAVFLRIGTYEIPQGATYETIAHIITGR